MSFGTNKITAPVFVSSSRTCDLPFSPVPSQRSPSRTSSPSIHAASPWGIDANAYAVQNATTFLEYVTRFALREEPDEDGDDEEEAISGSRKAPRRLTNSGIGSAPTWRFSSAATSTQRISEA